jgi:hypothetical protein
MHSIRDLSFRPRYLARVLAAVVILGCVECELSLPATAQGGGIVGPFADERPQSVPAKTAPTGTTNPNPTRPFRPVP